MDVLPTVVLDPLVWVDGETVDSAPWLITRFGEDTLHRLGMPAALIGVLLVLGLGYRLENRRTDPAH